MGCVLRIGNKVKRLVRDRQRHAAIRRARDGYCVTTVVTDAVPETVQEAARQHLARHLRQLGRVSVLSRARTGISKSARPFTPGFAAPTTRSSASLERLWLLAQLALDLADDVRPR